MTDRNPPRARRGLRVHRGELISLGSALLLVIAMFALEWYGVDEMPRWGPAGTGLSHGESAWHALSVVRWVMLAAIVVSLGSVVLHATQRSHNVKTDTGLIVWLVGSSAAALLVYRVLINLPSPDSVVDQKLGAYLGLLCAVGIAFGGFESLREERARARRAARRSRPHASRFRPHGSRSRPHPSRSQPHGSRSRSHGPITKGQEAR